MVKNLGPLFLGIDYGTTRVKATLITEDEIVLNSFSTSWTEANCSKYFLSDWLKILKMVVREVFSQSGLHAKSLSRIAITTISPSLVLVDPNSANISSPILLYDEKLPNPVNDTKSKIHRINASIKVLIGFTPHYSNREKTILTANGWLVWQLTGELVVDSYSLLDCLGDFKVEEVVGAKFPECVLNPTDVVGLIKKSWSESLNVPLNVEICCGGPDTIALVRAAKLRQKEHLIYLGTFFSVLEALEDLSKGIYGNYKRLPYRWHISLEGGALLERLAATYFPLEEDRSKQIAEYLKMARKSLVEKDREINHIIKTEWFMGKPVYTLPILSNQYGKDNSVFGLAAIPFFSFAKNLKLYFEKVEFDGLVQVVGGLSSNEWIVNYLSQYAGISCSSKLKIMDAEGAALIAKDGTQR